MEFEIDVSPREKGSKSKVKNIRRLGDIPAVLYNLKNESENIVVKGDQFKAALRSIKNGKLPTTIFWVKYKSERFKTLVKEISYDITSYNILHLDLQKLSDTIPVSVIVPVQYVGEDACSGVKLGGFLRKVNRGVKVKCLPSDIPEEFLLDVTNLNIAEAKKVKDIAMPAKVTPISRAEDVIVIVARRKG